MPLLRLLTSGLRTNDGPQSSAYPSTARGSKSKSSAIPSPIVQSAELEEEDHPSPPAMIGGRRKSRLGTTLHLKPKAEISETEKERIYIKGNTKLLRGKSKDINRPGTQTIWYGKER